MKKRKRNNILAILKASRKRAREEEIAMFGKQISMLSFCYKNKKKYSRKIKHKSI